MKELQVIEQALNMAASNGTFKTISDVAQVFQCLRVVEAQLQAKQEQNKPGPSMTKEIIKK